MNRKFPELGIPLKNKYRPALDEANTHLEQSGHVVQAKGPHNQHTSAARWAGCLLNCWSKEFPEVPAGILPRRHKRLSTRYRGEVGTIVISEARIVELRRGEDALQRP